MQEFFQQYFIEPIVTQGVAGYNIFNTPVYALCFALAVFGAWKLLKRLHVTIDRRFIIGIIPFIISGSVWRVVRDSGIISSPILVTPLIYFMIFAAAVAGLLVSVGLEKWKPINSRLNFLGAQYYHKIWFAIGAIFLASGVAMLYGLPAVNVEAFFIIAALGAGWAILFFGLHKISGKRAFGIFTRENAGLLWAHLFDASTTFTALQFFSSAGYYEQHVVSNVVISALGPVGQFVLKLVVLLPVLWLLDRELKNDTQLRGFLKIAILILGLAPGLRNGLRLVFGV